MNINNYKIIIIYNFSMGCSSFNDKYHECDFLIEELKLIINQTNSGKYTENEVKALNEFKYEKENKIREFIDELEKESKDEFEKRKIEKLKEEFYDVIDEDDNSQPICNNNEQKKEENNDIQIAIT